ncbi:MAG: bifunctional folylpolyglutamate synthase/dihydrofolate synthase [Nitrospirae bacterium]|nr:bifunctional folylpolyglutamate synthase/dihydrofolate synthase [Candidatus Manganitrophaceae bacterium]
MPYADAIDYLYRLQWHGIQPGLERMERLLSLLSHPEKQYRSVHIGGTNGKGSTAATVAEVLKRGGYRVGLYTSPHLIDFSERIRLSGKPIPAGEIVRLTGLIRARIAQEAPELQASLTFFEFTTVIAFLYFAEQKIDLAVVEVGLGGRFDATNLLAPMVSAITQIDLDHERYLGTTVLQIAAEKAGIIKLRTPLVTGAVQPEVLSLFEEEARSKEAPLIRVDREITVEGERPSRFIYRGVRERVVSSPLLGRHQIRNAAISIGVIEQLQKQGIAVPEEAILEGVRRVRWSGRLEMIRKEPLILLDGAHNPAGARALADFLSGVDPERRGRHWLIVGIMRDKNISEILSPLLPWADEIVLTRPEIERAAEPDLLIASLPPSLHATIREQIPDAIAHVESLLTPSDTLVITGSLYTVGEAKAVYAGTAPSLLRG